MQPFVRKRAILVPMNKRTLPLFLFALLLVLSAHASTPAYEYYSLSSGPSVCAVQITAISGVTVYSAEGFLTTNWSWYIANAPHVGGYIVASCGSSFSALSSSDYSYMDESSFESDYGVETYAHGGHEPILFWLD